MPTADLLTTAQAAEQADVDVRTIHRWVASGRLSPALKLPGGTGAYLFDPASVAALLAPAETSQAAS